MKILFIVPYPTEGPSNRFRVEQYLPYLKENKIAYSVRPFFSSNLYKILYKKGDFFRKFFFFIFFSFRRVCDVVFSFNFDIVFIHREAFVFGYFIEWCFKLLGKKIIYDFDDALFLPNVSDTNRFIKIFKDTAKIKEIIKISDHVIAGNSFLMEYALNFNKNVSIIPTPIDTQVYRPLLPRKMNSDIVVGWIGSATTLKYLDIFPGILKDIFKKYKNIKFKVIGGYWNKIESSQIVCAEWHLDSEIADLQLFDIGIMPLTDDDWSRGKCAFKIIEYMAVGIPVVASAIGMNNEVIQDGVNGFLAHNEKEWVDKLSLLIENPLLRQKTGSTGRNTVEEKYSVSLNAAKLLAIINKVYYKK